MMETDWLYTQKARQQEYPEQEINRKLEKRYRERCGKKWKNMNRDLEAEVDKVL